MYQGSHAALCTPMTLDTRPQVAASASGAATFPRAVIAGIGAVTAHGGTANELWDNVRAGQVAIRPVRGLCMDGYRTRLGGEVQDRRAPLHEYRRPPAWREPAIDFALRAAEEAIGTAGEVPLRVDPERFGVVVGTCNAGLVSARRWYAGVMRGERPDPRLLLLVTPQALAEALSAAFGLKGPTLSINTACAAGANAIGYAAELVRHGRADAVLAGGADALSDVLFSGFNALESLSPEPAAPYCRQRQGLSLGEGAGMLVITREDIAHAGGAQILAEVAGYGISADGYHPTAPHPEGIGAARAIQAALDDAGVPAAAVGYVNTHGTGTRKNDPAETRATKLALGDAARRAAVSSTKSMVGHLLGAAGAVEGIVTAKALAEQLAPPTANLRERDPECDLDCVPGRARPLQTGAALSNNFAFAGSNASIVLTQPGAGVARRPPPRLERAVVTGFATLTCAGSDPEVILDSLAAGRRSVEPVDGVLLGRVTPDPAQRLSRRERRRMDRLGIFAVTAAGEAVERAGLTVDEDNRERIGVVVGSGVGPMEAMEDFARPVMLEGAEAANPAVFPNTVYNAAGGQVAMHVGAVGPASTVTTGHAAGAAALCYAHDLIAHGRADAMLAVAVDTLTDTVIRAYGDLGLLAGDRPAAPHGSGFALAEAGVAVLLESETAARARGARVYGEILGHAVTADAIALGRVDRRGRGIERAMRLAVEHAGLVAEDIGTVWASTAGHSRADRGEAAAIQRTLGDRAGVEAPKLLLGEPMGAGGALAAALVMAGWRREAQPGRPVLVNSCSLGGTNVSLVLAPPSTTHDKEGS